MKINEKYVHTIDITFFGSGHIWRIWISFDRPYIIQMMYGYDMPISDSMTS